jgi:hypothetical protein
MRWKIMTGAMLGALLLGASASSAVEEEAVCVASPKEKWASAEAVTARLSQVIDAQFALGLDKGCYEAEVVINDETMIDIYVDPVTTNIVRIRTNGEEDS